MKLNETNKKPSNPIYKMQYLIDPDPCGCGPDGTCDIGTRICTCASGYQANYYLSTNKCEDVDKCRRGDKCHPLAKCENFAGSYRCTCEEPFTGDGENFCGELHVISTLNELSSSTCELHFIA